MNRWHIRTKEGANNQLRTTCYGITCCCLGISTFAACIARHQFEPAIGAVKHSELRSIQHCLTKLGILAAERQQDLRREAKCDGQC